MKIVLAVLVLAALAACSTTPPIDAAQLAAVTKENNASVGCATGTGPWGRAGIVYVNAEHASVAAGNLTVNTDCSVSITATGTGAPPALPTTPAK